MKVVFEDRTKTCKNFATFNWNKEKDCEACNNLRRKKDLRYKDFVKIDCVNYEKGERINGQK